ncbi:MAG: M23 family metallopeptidase [Clostridia bacterium]
MIRLLKIIIIAFIIVLAIIVMKYKVAYKVTISGEEVGYVTNKVEFEKLITQEIINPEEESVAYVDVENMPEYHLQWISRQKDTNEDQIYTKIQQEAVTTYKVYAIALNGENMTYVNSKEEAQEATTQIKEEYAEKIEEVHISINEIYTQDIATVQETVEVASAINVAQIEVENVIEEQERIKSCTLDGIYFAVKPVSGNITSRFGANESIRDHTHKGLDIAAPNGTTIKAAAGGTVTYAGWMSGYGNLVIISHGNGIQTYYGHCSKLYVSKGKTVEAGDKIAAVGSTGNSTGNHLHFEIRKNGKQINPQTYVYK